MVRITLLLFALFPLVFGAKELLEDNGLMSDDKDANADDVLVKRSVDIAARRRSALDKNFMRFGRSDPDMKQNGKSTQNPCTNKNCDRIGRDNANMMRFGRSGNNLMRFGRGNNNPMRFGRSGINLMRFGRGNLMRFGRSGNNLMRFGRSDDDFNRYLDDCDCSNRDDDNADVMKMNEDESYDENKIDDALLRFAKIISHRPADNSEPDNLSELFPEEMRKKRSLKASESAKRNPSEHPVPYYS